MEKTRAKALSGRHFFIDTRCNIVAFMTLVQRETPFGRSILQFGIPIFAPDPDPI
jgi:hypothetical protein